MSKICVPVKCHIWVQKVGIYHTMRAGVSTVSQFRAFYCGLRNAHKGGTVAYIFVSMTTYTHNMSHIYGTTERFLINEIRLVVQLSVS